MVYDPAVPATTFRQLANDLGAASSSSMDWPGGQGVLGVTGTLGTTNTFQWSPDSGTTWIPYTTHSAAGTTVFELPPCKIRYTISGGTPVADIWVGVNFYRHKDRS